MRLHQSKFIFDALLSFITELYLFKNNDGFFKTTTLEPLRHKKPDLSKIRFLEVRFIIKKRHETKKSSVIS
jgi:hypothetical protein